MNIKKVYKIIDEIAPIVYIGLLVLYIIFCDMFNFN